MRRTGNPGEVDPASGRVLEGPVPYGYDDGPPDFPAAHRRTRKAQCEEPAVAGGSSTWTFGSPASTV
jgi:hypothetical protein